jgi:ABC-type Fe3+-hydroxamate transport system substrate-binding protein
MAKVTITTTEKDLGYKSIMASIKESKGSFVDVGVFGGTTPEGSTIAQVAVANEFGTSRIPERSFMRSTVDENQRQLVLDLQNAQITAALTGKSAETVLKKLGVKIEGLIKTKIRDLKYPPNAPSTQLQKGGVDNPLINRGEMRAAITNKTGRNGIRRG